MTHVFAWFSDGFPPRSSGERVHNTSNENGGFSSEEVMYVSGILAIARLLGTRRQRLTVRFVAVVFVSGSAAALLLTALALHGDYVEAIAVLEARLGALERAHQDSLAEALWAGDRARLASELEAMVREGQLGAAWASGIDAEPLTAAAQGAPGRVVARSTFALVRRVGDADRLIGIAHLEATPAPVYRALAYTAERWLLSHAVALVLICLAVAFALRRLVIGQVLAIEHALARVELGTAGRSPALGGSGARSSVEFERVDAAFDAMLARVGHAYSSMREVCAAPASGATVAAQDETMPLRADHLCRELRAPLDGMCGHAQILSRDGALSAGQRERALTIMDFAQRVSALLGEFFAAESKDVPWPAQNVEAAISDVIESIRDAVAVKAMAKGLRFACEVDPGLPPRVCADEQRLCRVLLELSSNAVRFTSHGAVGLLVTNGRHDTVRFEVRDTSAGIRADRLESIFHPFERDHGRETGARGRGFGLALSRQLVRAMGGDIHVQSEPGAGSTFSFALAAAPRSCESRAARRGLTGIAGYEGPRHSVLVLEAAELNRALLSALLEGVGFTVVPAATLTDARAVLRAARLSAAVCVLPVTERGARAFVRRLRGSCTHGAFPVIAVSPLGASHDVRLVLEAGADALLPAPLEFGRLLLEIGSALRLRWIGADERLSP